MNTILFDFALCRCGYRTPIHPYTIAIADGDRRWIETENSPVFFVCNGCKRIYELETDKLVAHSIPLGLEPYNPGASMRRFEVLLPCAEALNCIPIKVVAVLKADTTDEELEKEKSTWRGRALKCALGHFQTFPSGWGY